MADRARAMADRLRWQRRGPSAVSRPRGPARARRSASMVDTHDLPQASAPFADRGPLPAGQAGALVSQVGARHPLAVRPGAGHGGAPHRDARRQARTLATRRDRPLPRRVRRARRRRDRSRVRLDVICNKPAVDAAGYLTYGNGSVGIINWATCLMYPEGPSADETRVDATFSLPAAWGFACALKGESTGMGGMIGGRTMRRVGQLPRGLAHRAGGQPGDRRPSTCGRSRSRRPAIRPAFLNLVSESPTAIEVEPEGRGDLLAAWCRRPARCSAPAIIRRSTSWSRAATTWATWAWSTWRAASTACASATCSTRAGLRGWVGNLLPHEYVHSWCGKFRRPAGMCTPNFHTPQKTRAALGLRGAGRVPRRGPDGPLGDDRPGGVPPDAHGEHRLAVASRGPALAVARGHGDRLAPAPRRQPQLERAEARAGLLLRRRARSGSRPTPSSARRRGASAASTTSAASSWAWARPRPRSSPTSWPTW